MTVGFVFLLLILVEILIQGRRFLRNQDILIMSRCSSSTISYVVCHVSKTSILLQNLQISSHRRNKKIQTRYPTRSNVKREKPKPRIILHHNHIPILYQHYRNYPTIPASSTFDLPSSPQPEFSIRKIRASMWGH